MRKLALAIAVTALMTSCSSCSSHSNGASAISAPTAQAGAPGTPQTTVAPHDESPSLADLTQGVDGKILAHHVDDKAEFGDWNGEFTAHDEYNIIGDCTGVTGHVTVKISDGMQWIYPCSDGARGFFNGDILATDKAYHLTVNAPEGARWAILVYQPS